MSAKLNKFSLTADGVYVRLSENGKVTNRKLCSPLFVKARTRDGQGENAGLLLEWNDLDGKVHRWTMPRALLAGDGMAIREALLSRGFGGMSKWRGASSLFIEYLMTARPEKVSRNTSRIGWHNEMYVLPDKSIGADEGEEIVLQSNVDDYRLTTKGTLDEWRENVARYCEGNSRLVFAVSVGFAAPLLRPLGQAGGGFHYRGNSSRGKSTATTVASSVYGGGDSKYGYARKWRTTANALEVTAEMHNDGLLVLDEISLLDPRDAGTVAYQLADGGGKGRMDISGKLRRTAEYSLLYLSTGEISLADHAAQAGMKTRAGQEVRLCDIPADTCEYGVFEDLHGFSDGDSFATTLLQNALNYYGSAIRPYLREIVKYGWEGIRENFREYEKSFLDTALKTEDGIKIEASGEVSRVAHRFALVAYAGELATDLGITGWAEGSAGDSAVKIFKEWLDNRDGTGNLDEKMAVAQVRKFLAEYGSTRFDTTRIEQGEILREGNRIYGKQAGFIIEGGNEDEELFCVFPETFRDEVCSGYDTKMVCEDLHKRGWLIRDDKGNTMVKRPPGSKGTRRVYVISNRILGD
jgi:putative DNA primase/helicase